MEIKGEVKSAKVSRKIDDNNRDITVLDLRIKIPTGTRTPVREFIDLTGVNAIMTIEKAQITLEEARKGHE